MITTKTNLSIVDVNEHLDTIAKSESIICNSILIYTDMCISLREFTDQMRSETKPRDWYFAIRENGTEASERREYVRQRCHDLGAAHIAFHVIFREESNSYDLTISRQ